MTARNPLIAAIFALAAASLSFTAVAATALASPSSPTLPEIEPQVMCVTCRIPLNTAESPQADRERAYIRELIGKGFDESQIKKAMVSQYGPAVLSLPKAKGFNLLAYLIPALVVIVLLAALALLLPRWLRASRRRGPPAQPQPLSDTDAERLRRDMARFD